jgi:hypothetical protein
VFVALPAKTDTREYLPSHDFEGWIDEAHAGMPDRVRQLPGWLRDEDVLKLYELSALADGPVLEIGAYRGKSTVVLASAGSRVVSIDIDPAALAEARTNVAAHGLAERVTFIRGTAQAFAKTRPDFRPAVTFVDGDHSYEGATTDLLTLRSLVPKDGLLLFHDYLDELNADPEVAHIDVVRAVADSWVTTECEFAGTFGCCGLFRRTTDPPLPSAPPLVDLVPLDSLRMRYLQRVRRPLGRLLHRS